MVIYRYTAGNGKSDRSDLDEDQTLSILLEDLMNFGNVPHALATLLRRLRGHNRDPMPKRLDELDHDLARLDERRLLRFLPEALRTSLREAERALDVLCDEEVAHLRSELTKLDDQFISDMSFPDRFDAHDREFRREERIRLAKEPYESKIRSVQRSSGPVLLRMEALQHHEFVLPGAGERFSNLTAEVQLLILNYLNDNLTSFQAQLANDWRGVCQMLQALQELLSLKVSSPEMFNRFMGKHGKYFQPHPPASLPELIGRLKGAFRHIRGSYGSDITAGLDPGQQARLRGLTDLVAIALARASAPEIRAKEVREALARFNISAGFGAVIEGLYEHGYLRSGDMDPELTPKAIRRIGDQALHAIFKGLRRGRRGGHLRSKLGRGGELDDVSKEYAFGDPFHLDLSETLRNAIQRRGAVPVDIQPKDFRVYGHRDSTRAATVVALDLSWSMAIRGSFPAAKRAILALVSLIRSRYPNDILYVVGFSAYARTIPPHQIPYIKWDDNALGTNIHHTLSLCRQLLQRHPDTNKQIVLVTDGEPTAHTEKGRAYFSYPASPITIRETLREATRCAKSDIDINVIMLDRNYYLKQFVSQLAEVSRGRAFYSTPERLGQYLVEDYVDRRHD